MGQNAVYIAVDDQTAKQLWPLGDELFRSRFLEIEEDPDFARLDIAKIWDALHCTMTGVSASEPIEDNKLSEAIVGVDPKIYDDEDYSVFVSIIDNQDLAGIVEALKAITTAKLKQLLDPHLLERKNVYPQGIWEDEPDALIQEMDEALDAIRDFFTASQAQGLHVLSTIM